MFWFHSQCIEQHWNQATVLKPVCRGTYRSVNGFLHTYFSRSCCTCSLTLILGSRLPSDDCFRMLSATKPRPCLAGLSACYEHCPCMYTSRASGLTNPESLSIDLFPFASADQRDHPKEQHHLRPRAAMSGSTASFRRKSLTTHHAYRANRCRTRRSIKRLIKIP